MGTDRMLSWDVADPREPKNNYKRCPQCNAVWIKVQGCDGTTTCGSVPDGDVAQVPTVRTRFVDQGGQWGIQMVVEGVEYAKTSVSNLYQAVANRRRKGAGQQKSQTKTKKGIIESGCGLRYLGSQCRQLRMSRRCRS